jgi:hypothetical protein
MLLYQSAPASRDVLQSFGILLDRQLFSARDLLMLTMTLRSLDVNQAARANCSSAILVFAPINESEQLGSQTRTALLTSKPAAFQRLSFG